MKKVFVLTLATCLLHINAAHAADTTISGFDVPATCKNLAILETEMLQTRFNDGSFAGPKYNPGKLTLKTDAGYSISKMEYLGGDSEDQTGPNAGNYPCDTQADLCKVIPDAGGAFDWARITVNSNDDYGTYPAAEVVVSMGSRGGCIINSAKATPMF